MRQDNTFRFSLFLAGELPLAFGMEELAKSNRDSFCQTLESISGVVAAKIAAQSRLLVRRKLGQSNFLQSAYLRTQASQSSAQNQKLGRL